MFEHLDDPDGFRPSTTLLRTVTRDGRRRRRRTRLVQAGTASVTAVALGAGVVATTFNRKLDSVERVEVATLVDPPADPAAPYTLLLTGVDAPLSVEGGAVPPPRSDTIALVRLFPAEERVTFIQIPRDLLVDIPGHGAGRINSALPIGGPALLVEVIEQNLGLTVNHYASVDFEGARRIGDAVGGLRFDFEYPTRDRRTGFSIETPGCHTLDGEDLLAFARSRYLETEVTPGNWVVDQGYDLSRIARQQDVAMAVLAAFSRLDPADPAGVNRFIDAVVENVQLDASIERDAMLDLFRDVAGSQIVDVRFGYEEGTLDDGAIVLVPVRDRSYEEALHLFVEGELPADRPPVVPTDVFPPSALQPQPQHHRPC